MAIYAIVVYRYGDRIDLITLGWYWRKRHQKTLKN